MTTIDSIAIFGAFAGLLGALTGGFAIYYTYFKEKPSLKISFPYEKSNIIFRCSQDQDGYNQNHRLIIYARIENTSSLPIGIYEIRLKSTYLNSFSNSIVKAKGVYKIFDRIFIYYLDLENNQLKLPINLPSYEIVEGFTFFVYDELSELPPFCLTFEIHTTRGVFTGTTKLDFFNGIEEQGVQNNLFKSTQTRSYSSNASIYLSL